MRTAGIIAEYNPFHEGHRYHIEETRKVTGADYVIVAMSGDYVQRGEPAIVDKYVRTEMALKGGADVVIELPTAYATASAEHFAGAGVSLLDQLGVCDYLSFGSEWADAEEIEEIAGIFCEEPEDYKAELREGVSEGMSYPAARAEAVATLFPLNRRERIRKLLDEPNHILGVEYAKAVRKTGSRMKCIAIPRAGAGYHQIRMEDGKPSATAIRKALSGFSGKDQTLWNADDLANRDRLARALGEGYDIFMDSFLSGACLTWDDFIPFLRYTIIMEKEMLHRFAGIDLELAARIRNLFRPEYTFEDLVQTLHARNRTDTAVRRALLHILLKIPKQPFLEDGGEPLLPYARILGFRKTASSVLKSIREKTCLDIIQRPALGQKLYTRYSDKRNLYRWDMDGADLYECIAAEKREAIATSELIREQIIL